MCASRQQVETTPIISLFVRPKIMWCIMKTRCEPSAEYTQTRLERVIIILLQHFHKFPRVQLCTHKVGDTAPCGKSQTFGVCA